MAISKLMKQDASRRYAAVRNAYYAHFLHSVYNESRLYSQNGIVGLSGLQTREFKYTFFLLFKREVHSQRASQLRNRCMYYGRARAVSTTYRMSRFAFKRLGGLGYINGVSKSS